MVAHQPHSACSFPHLLPLSSSRLCSSHTPISLNTQPPSLPLEHFSPNTVAPIVDPLSEWMSFPTSPRVSSPALVISCCSSHATTHQTLVGTPKQLSFTPPEFTETEVLTCLFWILSVGGWAGLERQAGSEPIMWPLL